MTRTTRSLAIIATIAALAGTGAWVVPAAQAASPQTDVTIFLKAPHPAALDRLAQASGLTHQQRVAALATLVPSAATVSRVSKTLSADGLAVTGDTAWSIEAHGPQSTVAALFGARPAAVAHPDATQLRAESGALPAVPAELAGSVIAAFPTTGGPAVFHHADAVPLNGGDFRNAYTPANVSPPGGDATATNPSTIATLQLANYNNGDLTTYASMQSPALPNIVGTSKYHEVTVDGGPSESDDVGDGDVEVDLDQESILSTAPSATQRPYFAPNTEAGFDDVFANVFDDVVQNSKDNDGGDPNIVALSSSWGECESGTGAQDIQTAETVIKALVAAGVTVFASSGDDGIYDCGDQTMTGVGPGSNTADVDYPASSPEVVGVGGTNLQYTGTASAPNNGSNWNESAWTCTDDVSCESSVPVIIEGQPGGTGGTGGGESGSAYQKGTSNSFAGFSEPAYQSQTIADAPFTGQKHRLVPDIASDGDPDTGFDLYTTDSEYYAEEQAEGGYLQVGGTSLSSPTSAALLTNTLAAAGRHTGIGDIHGALYSAYADKVGAFRDVTQGSNGASADKSTDPSVNAQAGYDTASGLGGVLWPALSSYLLSTAAPKESGSIHVQNLHSATKPETVKVAWTTSKGTDPIVPGTADVKVTAAGTGHVVFSATADAPTGSARFAATPGTTYRMTVTGFDVSGHPSNVVTGSVAVPLDDTAFTYHGKWHRTSDAKNIRHSHAWTSTKGAYAVAHATGRSYRLALNAGPARGELAVYRGGKLIKTVNLYAKHWQERVVHIFGSSSTARAARSFRIVCLHRKAAGSTSTSIAVDGLYVS